MELFLREALLVVIGLLLLFLACKIIFGTYFYFRKKYIIAMLDHLMIDDVAKIRQREFHLERNN
jgi:hypothetical protein